MANTEGMNWGRAIMGGVVAGVVLAAFGVIIMLAVEQNLAPFLSGVERAPSPFPTAFSVMGLVVDLALGLWAVWLYASIRPRYGPGPVTAAVAGLASWLIIALGASAFCLLGNLQLQPTLMSLIVFLVPTLVAVVAGASLYAEEEPLTTPVRTAEPKAAEPRKPAAKPAPAPAKAPQPSSTVPPVKPTAPALTVPPVASSPPPAPPAPAVPPPAKEEPAPPPPPPAQAPAAPSAPEADMEEKRQELQESMVAMELNDEVAVREVLRVFGKGGMSVEQIVQQLETVNWNFGEIHPRVAVTSALKSLLGRGKVKEADGGKWEFSR